MYFNDELGQFVCENNGLIFAWDEEPNEDISNIINRLTDNYYSHIDEIAQFMLLDLKQMYGEVDVEVVKEMLGKPIIDYDNGRVSYLEQRFDSMHIFEFEFLDDAVEELQYFSVNG